MPAAPGRQELNFMYIYNPSYYNYQYYTSVYVKFHCFFRSIKLLHTTTTINDYQTLSVIFNPYGAVSQPDASNMRTLRVSVQARYHLTDGGITDIYTADNRVLNSGSQFSGIITNPNNNQITSIQFGQPTIKNAPLMFSFTNFNNLLDNTQYTFTLPLLKNPSIAFISLRYNVSILISPTSSYEYVHNHYESINEYFTVADTSTSFVTSINNNNRAVQSVGTVDLQVNIGSASLTQWHVAIFKINNALPALLQAISSPNDTANYDYKYFKVLNMIVAQKKSTNTIGTIGVGSSSSAINYQSTFGISWVKVFSTSNAPMATNPFTLRFSTPSILTLNHLTTYSSRTVTLL